MNKYVCSKCTETGYHVVTLDKSTLDPIYQAYPGEFKGCSATLYPNVATYRKTTLLDSKNQPILVPSTCDNTVSIETLTKGYLVV